MRAPSQIKSCATPFCSIIALVQRQHCNTTSQESQWCDWQSRSLPPKHGLPTNCLYVTSLAPPALGRLSLKALPAITWEASRHCASQGAPLMQETKQSKHKRHPRVSQLLIIATASTKMGTHLSWHYTTDTRAPPNLLVNQGIISNQASENVSCLRMVHPFL